MSISLIVKRKVSSHFTIIPNDVINDKNLSWKSLGLLVKLLSLPPGCSYLTMESLSKKNGTGAAATRSGLHELETAGYLSIERTHDSRGRFAKTVWHISDEPSERTDSAPYCENPKMDNPKTDQPHLEKQAHINTKQTIKPKNKKTTTSLDSALEAGDPPLRLAALVSAETRSQIFKALELVAPVDQQRMLNELSAAIKAGSIKTTAIRWFHGVIKRYRDGSYNFKDQSSAWEPTSADNAPPRTPTATPRESPSTVKNEGRSTVGKEYLKKLKINRSSSGLSPVRILTVEGPEPSSET
ncbi:helix-turn-helix domain-containing protein [Pseudomonas fulva]|uniref:helix-turn-helix domain-containing protein n=1 Tax=Pseudomonas TaxID=286 RepID=UPI00157B34C0|nr:MULTISPECIES: helix-turn-helix domain-containing protein [Pseudomonas]WIV24426.1 helix-turn-helix domain-containing protein [Pseudomonas sp. M2(2023)]